MLVNSATFLLLFVPAVALLRRALPPRQRQAVLIAASVVFIATWGWWSLAAVATALAITAGAIQLQERSPRAGLAGGLVALTALLAAPKLVALSLGSTDAVGDPLLRVVGLSFITLNLMSVIIDRYRGRIEEPIGAGDLVAFGSCFAYVAAGPLVRWRELAPQLRSGRDLDAAVVSRALMLIAAGLAKKTLLADPLGLRVDQLLSHGMPDGLVGAWLATIGFGVQIYFDFSGYTDMALGIGLLVGLQLPPNFNAPYRARSIADFWRRWHMTLAAWVRDYVFLGLGLGRSHARAMFNMVVAMTIVGLWHGFTPTFVAWGVYHGVLLAAYYALRSVARVQVPIADWVARAVTFAAVTIGWALFRAPSLREAGTLVASLGGVHGLGSPGLVRNYAGSLFVILTAIGFVLTQILPEPWQIEPRLRFTVGLAYGAALALAVMALGGRNPFLYMQY